MVSGSASALALDYTYGGRFVNLPHEISQSCDHI
jgi:hypothetical protein